MSLDIVPAEVLAVPKPIVTRADARRSGIKRYYTGRSCPHGHFSERLVSCGVCVVCSDANKAAWAKKNPERAKKISSRHYEKNTADYIQRAAAWKRDNPEKSAASCRASQSKPESKRLKLEAERRRRAIDPESFRSASRNRRARRKAAAGAHTAEDVRSITKSQGGRCSNCACRLRRGSTEVDHILPLAKGGTNHRSNLQIMCRTCNRRKGAKHPIEFSRQQGRLI